MAKTAAVIVKCTGAAHSNPHIDNCMVCLPYWGEIPTCPVDGRKLADSGYCRDCKKFYGAAVVADWSL